MAETERYEENGIVLDTKAKVTSSGKKLSVTWGKVAGATNYEIYVTTCGSKVQTLGATVSGSKTKATIGKMAGKTIKPTAIYEVQVRAYRMIDGEKQLFATSTTLHVAGAKHKKYTNAKKVVLKKKKLTLKKGKKKSIKAKVVKQKSRKNCLP